MTSFEDLVRVFSFVWCSKGEQLHQARKRYLVVLGSLNFGFPSVKRSLRLCKHIVSVMFFFQVIILL